MPSVKKEKVSKTKVRHHYSSEDKQKILAEAEKDGETISSIARKHDISASQLFLWKKQLNGKSKKTSVLPPESSPLTQNNYQEYIAELERVLGKKTVEVEQLKEKLGSFA
ncbi:MAG: transposase [Deltaproteobacteria bacterium]|nr:transposase [Deltaproteobacteria bacterium]